jgi:DNA adenine methylase
MAYVEGCFGGGNVLYNKKPSVEEIACETNQSVYLAHYCLQFPSFIKRLRETQYSEETFKKSLETYIDPLDSVWAEYCKRRMSRSGAGEVYSWSNRLRGGQPECLNAWEGALKNLEKFRERISTVRLYNESILKLLPNYSDPNTLIYLDPPYVHETRQSQREYGPYEWKVKDHRKMARLVNKSAAKIVISGYDSTLYDEILKGWRKEKREIANHSGQNKKKQKRIEVLWLNY